MDKIRALIKKSANLFREKNWQIASAESCTGGLIAAFCTELPGSSQWFERGFVTYSNLAKEQMLGVPASLIKERGAVSEAVARAMAEGALKGSVAQFSLAVTGIAGPEGGSKEKPVGMVCFAWSGRHLPTASLTSFFSGTREEIRLAACEAAIQGLLQYSTTDA